MYKFATNRIEGVSLVDYKIWKRSKIDNFEELIKS